MGIGAAGVHYRMLLSRFLRDSEDTDVTPMTTSKREHTTFKQASHDAKIQLPVSANCRVQKNSGCLNCSKEICRLLRWQDRRIDKMSHPVRTTGLQQPGERLRCRSLRRQRQEASNKRREPGGLDMTGVLFFQGEITEHRSVIGDGLLHAHTSGSAATLLRHAPAPKLVETAHNVLCKIFFTDRLPREKSHGAGKKFCQETDHSTEQSGNASL